MVLHVGAPDGPHAANAPDATAAAPPTAATAAALEAGTTDGHWQPAHSKLPAEAAVADDDTCAPAPAVATRPPRPAFFSKGCGKSLASALLLYCAALALGALLAHGQRHLGLIVLSLLPAAFSMGYMRRLFPKATLRSEMILTFFWTMVWMSPLVVVENVAYFGALTESALQDEGAREHSTAAITWGYKLLSAFVRAYLLAAFFEEASKYMALRRLRRARHVTDPRALAVYGLCAGAAFGTVEDLFIYAFAYGIDNTLARAFLSVPLHCMTGLLMGLSLAEDRFLHPGSRPWHRTLLPPVLLHGTFDAANFLLDGIRGEVALAIEILIVLLGFALARRRLLELLRLHPVEHDLVGLLARAAQGDKLAAAEARALHDEAEAGPLGPLARVASGGLMEDSGRARAGSGDGYVTELDVSTSTVDTEYDRELCELEAAAGDGGEKGKGVKADVEVPLVGPSRKAIALTGLLGCGLTAGMLCFLYLAGL